MGTNDLQRFIGGSQDKGLNLYDPDIVPQIEWDEATVNVSCGIRRGVGPRSGITPLPGHADTETLAGTNTNGLMASEGSSGAGLIHRNTVFAVVPVTLAPYAGAYPKTNLQYYVWIVGLASSGFDACISSTLSSSVNIQASDIRAGLAQSSYREESPLVRKHKTEFLNLPTITTPTAADMAAQLKPVDGRYWIPAAHISITGKRVPYQWMLGKATSVPDGTHAPNLNLWDIPFTTGTSPTVHGGEPAEIETRGGITNVARAVSVLCLTTAGAKIDIQYALSITDAKTAAVPAYGTGDNYSSLSSAAKTGASTSYSNVKAALINDPGSYTNSTHEVILVAGELPIAIVYQDWLKAVKGMMPRYVDLTSPACAPRTLTSATTSQSGAFPAAAPGVGGPNSGILRANTQYDFGFSFYNKQLDYETNVALGMTTTITPNSPGDDFLCLTLDDVPATGTTNFACLANGTPLHAFPWEFSDGAAVTGTEVGRGFHVNDFEYRFYYRQAGTAEWLPGGSIDAAQYWFSWSFADTSHGPQWCTGPSGALPGGYAGGFVDYSPLPKQRYNCTLIFRGRAFWFADKAMQFSLQNNIYAYPTRNAVSAQTGTFLGGIVHTQLNKTESTGRLIVFGSNQTYQARFTGNLSVQNVRVSADTVGQFEVEGSDFAMDYLCESTAYSYRAACIAEGVLYFWGAQGVYYDDGTMATPDKLSQNLEQEIFDLVDPARRSEVHCIYNKRTKEVCWFYPPNPSSKYAAFTPLSFDLPYPTAGLIYNVMTDKFTNVMFKQQIDSAQLISLQNDSSTSLLAGDRVIIMSRHLATDQTKQRAFFFDDLCQAGEQSPQLELMVKTIATPSVGKRRLTVAGGSDMTSVGVGDSIGLQNTLAYATSLSACSDMVCLVDTVDTGSGTIDIILPSGASMDGAATLAQGLSFPIFHASLAGFNSGLHGISYKILTNYWLPTSLADSWLWRYLLFMFRYNNGWIHPTVATALKLTYRTLVCGGFVTGETLGLTNNADGHCQIHHPLKNTNVAATGQALRFQLSGVHIGDPWTLEYLEAHCTQEKGFTLKQFEG